MIIGMTLVQMPVVGEIQIHKLIERREASTKRILIVSECELLEVGREHRLFDAAIRFTLRAYVLQMYLCQLAEAHQTRPRRRKHEMMEFDDVLNLEAFQLLLVTFEMV